MEYIVTIASRVNNGKSSQTEIHLIESKLGSSQYNDFPLHIYISVIFTTVQTHEGLSFSTSLTSILQRKIYYLLCLIFWEILMLNDPIYSESVVTNVYKCW